MKFGSIALFFGYISTISGEGTSREITLTNYCKDTIWMEFTSGAAPYANGIGSCKSDSDCIQGSVCNTDNSICFWDVPVPSSGTYRLNGGGDSSLISMPVLDYNIIWSGNIRACKNGTCSKSSDECDASGCRVNATSPVTLVCHILKFIYDFANF
jgi:hypothetical protein